MEGEETLLGGENFCIWASCVSMQGAGPKPIRVTFFFGKLYLKKIINIVKSKIRVYHDNIANISLINYKNLSTIEIYN